MRGVAYALALIVGLGLAETATMAVGREATVNLNSPDASLKTIPVQSSQVRIT